MNLDVHIKHLIKHSAVYTIGNVLSKALVFFLMPLYTRFLPIDGYGIVETIRVFIGVFLIVYFFGLEGAVGRFYFDFSSEEEEKRKEYLGNIFVVVMIISFCLSFLLSFFGKPLFFLISPEVSMDYVRLGIWTAFLSVPLFFLLPILQVQRRSGHYIVFQIFQVVLVLFGSLVFVVILKEGVWGKLVGDLVAGGSVFLIVCLYIGFKKIFYFSFNWKYIKDSLKFGIPIVPHLLSAWIFNLSNRLILQHFYPMSEVGIYSVGHNIGMIMLILMISFNNAWAPFMFDQAKNSPDAKQLFSKLTTYYVIALCIIALLLSAMSRWIVMVMTTHGYEKAVGIAEIVIASYAIYGLYFMLTNQIWYSKKTGYLPIITGTTALLSIGANFLLIPKWGMLGAAYSLMLSSVLIVFLTYIFSSKVYHVVYQKGVIGLCFLVATCIFVVNGFVALSNIWLELVLKWAIVLTYPLFLWGFGLLSKQEKEKIISFLTRCCLRSKKVSLSAKEPS